MRLYLTDRICQSLCCLSIWHSSIYQTNSWRNLREQTSTEGKIIAQKWILLSDHLVIKAFKYAFLWKEGSGKIDPYSVSKLLMCQIAPEAENFYKLWGKTSSKLLSVTTCVKTSSQSKSPPTTCIFCFAIKFTPHLLSISLSVRAALSPRTETQWCLASKRNHTLKKILIKKKNTNNTRMWSEHVTPFLFFWFSFGFLYVLYAWSKNLQRCCILS